MFQTQQSTQQNEDRYGNETKRRRLDDAGNHLKVWRMCEFRYILKPEQLEDPVPEMYEVEVIHEVNNEANIHEVQANNQVQANDQNEVEATHEANEVPAQFIGRRVVIYTHDNQTVRGVIQELIDLNRERAIVIQTNAGEHLIFNSSAIAGLEVLFNPSEEQLSPIASSSHEVSSHNVSSHEVVQIDESEADASEEVILIEDDASDASTQAPDQDDQEDDFPEVEFMPARRSQEQQPNEEHDCCAICLDMTDAVRNFVSLDCGHQFHFACIIGNMANGGPNRNQCPMCRSDVVQHYDVHNVENEETMNDIVERLARNNQRLQDELDLNRQHRADLTEEYVRVMSMNLQIGARHREERAARDALERRAEICILNERIAQVVAAAANNDIRQNYHAGARVHMERQIRDLCMSFGMMAYDAQYDDPEQYQGDQDQGDQYQGEQYQDQGEDLMNYEHEIINVD
jgi:hypothetical protein